MGSWWSKILVKRTNDGNKEQTEEYPSTHYLPQQPQSDTLHAAPVVDLPQQPQDDTPDDHDDQTAGSTATSTCSLWDRDNPDQQGLVLQSDQYRDVLRSNLTDLVQSVSITPMMPLLRQLDVINADRQERIELQATRGDMVMRMVSQVEKGPLWRLHGFLRGLAVTNQQYLIGVLGLDPTVYEDPPASDCTSLSAAAEGLNSTHDDIQQKCVDDDEGQEEIPMGPLPGSDAVGVAPIKTHGFIRKRGLLSCCGRSGLTSDRED